MSSRQSHGKEIRASAYVGAIGENPGADHVVATVYHSDNTLELGIMS